MLFVKRLVKKLIGEKLLYSFIRMLQKSKAFMRRLLILTMSRTPFSATLYYMFFSSAFRREHYTVMQGMVNYEKKLNNKKNNIYKLRRNIHRLEKGLIMMPRRSTFAKGYILETVEAFKDLCGLLDEGNDDLKWANDVLERYFSVVENVSEIKIARDIYVSIPETLNCQGSSNFKIPYHRDMSTVIPTYEDFYNLCLRRRSVRWYLPKPVPRTLVDNAIIAASQAPSACNRQPFRFKVIDDPKLLSKVSSLPGGTAGFSHNFQMIIVVIGDLSAYFDERDRHVIYIDGSLATMNLLMALETQGLSSCVINWPDVEVREAKITKTLNLPEYEKVLMLVSVGWPDPNGLVPYSQKKSLKELRGYN